MTNIALFGAGRIGKVHAATVAQNPDCNLSAVVDVYAPAAEELADKYGAKVMSSEDVFADANIDAIIIGSATNTHADLIESGAKSGKFIFCEKPVDLDVKRVNDCLAVVAEHNAKLMVGFNRRFDTHFAELKKRLTAGDIGKAEIVTIISRDPEPPPVSYIEVSGGLYRDMMIHDFDMACWLMEQEPIAVSASGSCLVDKAIGEAGDVDTAVVTLDFPNGEIAVITNSRRATYGYDQRIEVHGSEGMLQANNVIESSVVSSKAAGVNSEKPMFFFLERYADAYASELNAFIDMIQGKDISIPTGDDGKRALVLADAAVASLKSGKKELL